MTPGLGAAVSGEQPSRGRLVLMGSGEMAPGLVATHRAAIAASDATRVTVLDTPYGFQENADHLGERISDFFATSLRTPGEVASLRLAGEPPLAVETMVAAVRRSRYVFSGPGAPSHALRVWNGTGLVEALEEVIRNGGTVCFASAASLTLGSRTIPVYQIYKVGDTPHWHGGLDLTGRLGLPMIVVPHWNNAEGGTHDTSRCYVGLRRLRLMARTTDEGILGIDEHTAVTIDFETGVASVTGAGGISLVGPHGSGLGDDEYRVESGATIDIDALRRRLGRAADHSPTDRSTPPAGVPPGFRQALENGDADAAIAALLEMEASTDDDPAHRSALRSMMVDLGHAARRGVRDEREVLAPFVELLLDLREQRRSVGDFGTADRVRDELLAHGLTINDTPSGVEWDLSDDSNR